MHRPFSIGSAVNSPRPVRERLTISVYSPGTNFRFVIRNFLSPNVTFSQDRLSTLSARSKTRRSYSDCTYWPHFGVEHRVLDCARHPPLTHSEDRGTKARRRRA